MTILPKEWRFCKIGENKNPFEKDWPNRHHKNVRLTKKTKAIGVLCGPASGGLICVDIDGPLAEAKLSELGTIPKSVSWTSGKPHRKQIALWAYEEDWDQLHTTQLLKGIPGQELVLKWSGQQSVILGHHPETGEYRWINSPEDCEIAIAPDWLTELMIRPAVKATSQEDSLDAFLNGDHDLAISLLSQIPPAEDYQTWIKVGAALNAVSKATEVDLFQHWADWSAKAENSCSPEEYQAKWESFHRSPGSPDTVGLGSLMYLADQQQDDAIEPEIADEPLNVSWEEIKNWFYVANENKYCHLRSPTELIAPVNLNTRFKKAGIPKAAAKIKNSVDGVNWYPGKDAIYVDNGRKILNIHRPYPAGEPGDFSLFLKLVRHFYPEESELLFDFMAYTLQKPGDKINFAPYIVGRQGIGKNYMWEPLKQALRGEFHCIHNDYRSTQYNEYLLGRKLVIIDEPMNLGGSRFAIANELKGLIATTGEDDRLHINGKYRSYIEQVHLTNFAILTNFSDAIKVRDERRFYPCYSSKEPLSGDFYGRYAQWLSDGGAAGVIHWLMNRDLSDFNPKIAPAPTNSLAEIISDSQTELSEAIAEFVEEYEVVSFNECRDITKKLVRGNGADFITKNVVSELGLSMKTGKDGHKGIKVDGKVIHFRAVHKPELDSREAEKKLAAYIRKHSRRPIPDCLGDTMFV